MRRNIGQESVYEDEEKHWQKNIFLKKIHVRSHLRALLANGLNEMTFSAARIECKKVVMVHV